MELLQHFDEPGMLDGELRERVLLDEVIATAAPRAEESWGAASPSAPPPELSR